MSAQVQHVRLHTKEGAQQIIDDAVAICDEYEQNDDLRRSMFEKACDLLAAGVVLTPQPGSGDAILDLMRGTAAVSRGGR